MRRPLVAGIDEAGRGSLYGPLSVAALALRADKIKDLVKMGVKDSKKLSASTRLRLSTRILDIVDNARILLAPHWTVDKFASSLDRTLSINVLEKIIFAKLVCEINPDIVVVDSPDPKPARFAESVSSMLREASCRNARVIALNKADQKVPVVAAASIIAKVFRDKEIERYSLSYGKIGSGYPHDKEAREFLGLWIERFGELPFFARKSWSTTKTYKRKSKDKRLDIWLGL